MIPHIPRTPSRQQSQEQPSPGLITLARDEQPEADLEIKKSYFLARARYTNPMDEARDFIVDMRSTYPDVRHHRSALTFTDLSDGHALAATTPFIEHSNDDGEPSGTVGQPMFGVLRGTRLTSTTATVTRHFGGTLLGTDGLVRTYSEATAQALQTVAQVTLTRPHLWDPWVPVAQVDRIKAELRSRNSAAASGPTAEDRTAVLVLTTHAGETAWGPTHAVLVLATSYVDPDLLRTPLATLIHGEGAAELAGSRLVEVPVPPARSPGPSSLAPPDTFARYPRARIMLVTAMRADTGRA